MALNWCEIVATVVTYAQLQNCASNDKKRETVPHVVSSYTFEQVSSLPGKILESQSLLNTSIPEDRVDSNAKVQSPGNRGPARDRSAISGAAGYGELRSESTRQNQVRGLKITGCDFRYCTFPLPFPLVTVIN